VGIELVDAKSLNGREMSETCNCHLMVRMQGVHLEAYEIFENAMTFIMDFEKRT